jgi:short-subunit dehydrogenase
MASLRSKYGPRAMVTGAGAGIGEAFVEALAALGFEQLLVDVNGEALARVAAKARAARSDAAVLQADLTRDADLARVEQALEDPRIGLLINNAGISNLGEFADISIEQHEQVLALNCRATLRLVHRAARKFRQAGQGGIVIISSNSGLLHSPFVANYAGTKAYALALGEALYAELTPHGVDVLSVVPGLTHTPGLAAAGLDTAMAGSLMVSPSVVAEGSLQALGNTPRFIPNFRDRLGASALLGLMPRAAALSLNAFTMRRLFPRLRQR